MEKPAAATPPIDALLAKRWSPCAFAADYVLPEEHVLALAQAARWAPSSFGEEPWNYIFCLKHSDPEGWRQAFAALVEQNQQWVANASLLICATAVRNFRLNDKPNRHHLYDTGAASLALVLQAEALGLRAHQMAGFDPALAAANLAVPAESDCIAMIAVGKQAAADTLPPAIYERDVALRRRRDLGENFFLGRWGKPLG